MAFLDEGEEEIYTITMKIDKVSDNQIRCTLTKEDLAEREIRISEIAYGSEKARNLFRDVMQQASYEYGFEADNIPLMIEAVPMSSGCVVFIITKVEDPEELDTRFSKFAPSIQGDSEEDEEEDISEEGELLEDPGKAISDVFDLFKRISSQVAEAAARKQQGENNSNNGSNQPSVSPTKLENDTRLFSFDSLDNLAKACKIIDDNYTGASGLYKNPVDERYYLLLYRDGFPTKEFLCISSFLREYGTTEKSTASVLAYIDEHFEALVIKDAVHAMAQI